MPDARTVLGRLREGVPPSPDALRWFAGGLASGEVSDMQAGAFAMGVCLRGLGEAGRVALTLAMRDSGSVMRWDLPGPIVDKHSTGGVGDTVSLLLAPALAACGVFVPMVSGRGLGHTGGTLDKLEAIPGFRTELPEDEFRRVVRETGAAIVSATGEIAPADRRLYAVRDVTGTVESIDLITASILSKKLAAGLQALVLDVKVGSGAFLPGMAEAEALAQSLVDTANGAGCRTSALITDMSQPAAPALGNALEVAEVMRVFEAGGDDGALTRLTVALGGELLALAGVETDAAAGESRLRNALASGAAAERWARMLAAQGAPADFAESWRERLPQAPVVRDVLPREAGAVAAIDGRALGMVVVRLGGGRMRDGDRVDPAVGLSDVAPLGAHVGEGAPLARVHAVDEAAAERAAEAVRAVYHIGEPAPPPPLVHRRISA